METVILLTGCINPDGMSYTALTDIYARQEQYVNAIFYYLNETNCDIVFCENSNSDISSHFKEDHKNLEILTFSGNQDKQRGKGYGEAEIIDYAFQHSHFLRGNKIVIKITGRLIVNNIAEIVRSIKSKDNFISCLFHSDLTFADSRIICGTSNFYQEFLHYREEINDKSGIFFEHILSKSVLNSHMAFIPFSVEPLITGISGTTGKSYSTNLTNKAHVLRYKHYSLTQKKKIYLNSFHRSLTLLENFLLEINILKYKILLIIDQVG